ncbi:MAG TPA: S8 family serine peptidase [Thermoleophilaceae bacterium]|nr:S8 family serine peptidase [Thermoleophilaceae bacterium]
MSDVAGVSPDEASDAGEVDPEVLTNPEASVDFPDLGILIAGGVDRERADRIAAAVEDPENPLQAVVPERRYRALQEGPADEEWGGRQQVPFEEPPVPDEPTDERLVVPGAQQSKEFLEGYRAAVEHLMEKLAAADLPSLAAELAPAAFNESQFTWGLQATRAATSRFSGRGTTVAVLDTGLDLRHPDLAGRNIVSRSFVPNQAVQDGNGHGTHCIGTACGPRVPFKAGGGSPPSYGCASNSTIFAGKVLSDQGSGTTAGIIAGMQWAIASGCHIISMSLGRTIRLDETGFNPAYEQVARIGLQRGTLVIAAAGNDSARPGNIRPVSEPANSPSILAVGALDESLRPASFSNGGLFTPHGAVNIAAPGVNVYSSFPRPVLYRRLPGTSMATPHVAGIGALWTEANAMFRGVALANQLLRTARRLPLPSRDVGAGLVQAP